MYDNGQTIFKIDGNKLYYNGFSAVPDIGKVADDRALEGFVQQYKALEKVKPGVAKDYKTEINGTGDIFREMWDEISGIPGAIKGMIKGKDNKAPAANYK